LLHYGLQDHGLPGRKAGESQTIMSKIAGLVGIGMN